MSNNVNPINSGLQAVNSVTGTSGNAPIATINATNVYALFQNIGATDMYITFSGATASTTNSFLLKANGGMIEFTDFMPLGVVSVYSVGNWTMAYMIA